jgi:23S rRNA (pseudouridine1915-N3)-methyltransferase
MPALKIDVIAVGKLKERYWSDACDEYLKRCTPYAQLQLREVADRSTKSLDSDVAVRQAEAQDIGRLLGAAGATYSIMLDSAGRQLTSTELAGLLTSLQNQGISHMSFVIGGSTGLDTTLKQGADLLLSFGRITLPHNLARVVLLEQLYRAFKINRGEPYHK